MYNLNRRFTIDKIWLCDKYFYNGCQIDPELVESITISGKEYICKVKRDSFMAGHADYINRATLMWYDMSSIDPNWRELTQELASRIEHVKFKP